MYHGGRMNLKLIKLLKLMCIGWISSFNGLLVCHVSQCQSTILSLDQFHEIVSGSDDFIVVNVLPKDVYGDCHIPGTTNIPVHKLEKVTRKWPKNRQIVVHCAGQDCPLSRYATELLQNLGFLNIKMFEGGLREWAAQGLQIKGLCRAGYLKG
jgi:rhodanese-related sulfurtransferase